MTTQPQSTSPADLQSASTLLPAKSGKDGRGTTTVVDGVVATIAGIAAKDIDGVYALGGGAARMKRRLHDAMS